MTGTEELRAEAEALRQRANILARLADVTEAVQAANDSTCPTCSCQGCPAYVGHPGVCLFARLGSMVDAYHRKINEQRSQPGPIIEVP